MFVYYIDFYELDFEVLRILAFFFWTNAEYLQH